MSSQVRRRPGVRSSHSPPVELEEQGRRKSCPTPHVAGREMADSSSTTTSASLPSERHTVAVDKSREMYSFEDEEIDHPHWCMTCESPKSIRTCDGWKRHMREHERVYPCFQCVEKKYTRRTNLARHLREVHHLSEAAAHYQAGMWSRIETKKAYACGFCIRLFGTLRDQLNHIDHEHWRW